MQFENKQLDLTKYIEVLKTRRATFDEKHHQKIEHSFQELGIEMQQFFDKNIWHLFYKHKEEDLRFAFELCKRKQKKSVGYLLGVIRHKYKGF